MVTASGSAQPGRELRAQLDALLRADEPLLVEMRRDLHAHPELSGQEHATTEWLEQHLRDLGLAPVRLTTGTGVVCDLRLGDPGPGSPVVALRADIDALAMPDGKDVGYRSRVEGVAHACGHDVHTVLVLGAARALARLGTSGADLADVAGTVRLVFEPAEESVPGGAVDVLAEGHLEGVAAIFGLHCDPKIDLGRVGTQPGALTSAADVFHVRVTGPGGHTARPAQTVDLVGVLGQLVAEIQSAVDTELGTAGALNVAFGSVHAGNAANVIPSAGSIGGTLRTRDLEVWRRAPELFAAAVRSVVEPTGAGWEIDHRRGVPPVVNDPGMTVLLEEAVAATLGPDAVVETPQSLGGDSFAWFLEHLPGSYARLGVHDPTTSRPRLDLHASTFDVDERAIRQGAYVLATTALIALARFGAA